MEDISEEKTVRFSLSLSASPSAEITNLETYSACPPSASGLQQLLGESGVDMDKYEKYESNSGNIWLKKKISDFQKSSASRLRTPSHSFPTVSPFTSAFMHAGQAASAAQADYAGKSLRTYNATMAALLSKYKTKAEESEERLRAAAVDRSNLLVEMAARDEALKFKEQEGEAMKHHMQELLELMKANETALAEIRDENIKLNTELTLTSTRLDEIPVLEAKNAQLQDKLSLIENDKYNAERKCKILEERMEKSCKETRKFIESAVEDQNKSKDAYQHLDNLYHQLSKKHDAEKLELDSAKQSNLRLSMKVDELELRLAGKEREIEMFRGKQEENDALMKGINTMMSNFEAARGSRST